MTPSSSSIDEKANTSLVQRIGGESTFEFVVLGLVERLQADPEVADYFAHYNTKSLDRLQREVLKAVFTASQDSDDRSETETVILLRYYSLMERGFNATHFDILTEHLAGAMTDAWVNERAVTEVAELMRSFRRLFGDETETSAVAAPKSKAKVTGKKRGSSSGMSLLRLIPLRSLGLNSSSKSSKVALSNTCTGTSTTPETSKIATSKDDLDDLLEMYNEVLASTTTLSSGKCR